MFAKNRNTFVSLLLFLRLMVLFFFFFFFFCVLSSIRMISNKFMRLLQAYFLIGISLGN